MNGELLRLRYMHLGLPRTLAHYAGRALYRTTGASVYRVLCLDPATVVAPASTRADLEIGLVDAQRLRREALDPRSGFTPASVEHELAMGDTCYGAFVGGVLASSLFIAEGRTRVLEDVFVRFDPRWVLSRWAFTRAEFRGLHLHAAVKAHALGTELQRGRRGILSLVAVTNFESLQAAARLACRSVGWVATARVGGRRRVWSGRGCERYGLSLVVGPGEKPASVGWPGATTPR